MSSRSKTEKHYACLVCGACVGQLFPFCEWCGAKHSYTAEAELILTGGICQSCGFQSEFPLARCRQCETERRVLCPACSYSLPLRMDCPNCGLRWRFFDNLRRESQIQSALPLAKQAPARLLVATVLLAGLALLSIATSADRLNAAVILGCVAGSAAAALVCCYLRRGRQPKRTGYASELAAVLETFDPAEAAHARDYLRQLGIGVEVAIEAQRAVSSPPGSMRRVLVHFSIAERAYGALSEGGFNVGVPGVQLGHSLKRRRLTLIEGGGGGRRRGTLGRASTQSPQ